jgi:hypothetical protein
MTPRGSTFRRWTMDHRSARLGPVATRAGSPLRPCRAEALRRGPGEGRVAGGGAEDHPLVALTPAPAGSTSTRPSSHMGTSATATRARLPPCPTVPTQAASTPCRAGKVTLVHRSVQAVEFVTGATEWSSPGDVSGYVQPTAAAHQIKGESCASTGSRVGAAWGDCRVGGRRHFSGGSFRERAPWVIPASSW